MRTSRVQYVIPRIVPPQAGVLAWGASIPGTHIVPTYKADGRLWFVSGKLPADGSIVIESLPDLAPEPTDAEIVALRHAEADDETTKALCYFIGGATGLVKIGYSIDPKARLKSLQAGCPIPLQILAVRQGGKSREAAYHEQFRKAWAHGEWFKRTPAIKAEIARLATHPIAHLNTIAQGGVA